MTAPTGRGDHRTGRRAAGDEPDGASDGPGSDRLALVLGQLDVCLQDGARLVRMGRRHFDDDWLTRRAAKNIVTELAETANRLPEAFKRRHPQVPWRAISGMRNQIVHVYEAADPDIVWHVLARELPILAGRLGRTAT